MTIIDRTDGSQTDTISFDIDLEHPPEKVWRALTDSDLLAEWLLPVVAGDVEPGAEFTLQTQPYPGWDGTVDCRILEMDAPRILSYAWIVADMGLDTTVTFRLTPTSSGTRLSLIQSGFRPDQRQNFAGARYGWKLMSEKLVELLGRLS